MYKESYLRLGPSVVHHDSTSTRATSPPWSFVSCNSSARYHTASRFDELSERSSISANHTHPEYKTASAMENDDFGTDDDDDDIDPGVDADDEEEPPLQKSNEGIEHSERSNSEEFESDELDAFHSDTIQNEATITDFFNQVIDNGREMNNVIVQMSGSIQKLSAGLSQIMSNNLPIALERPLPAQRLRSKKKGVNPIRRPQARKDLCTLIKKELEILLRLNGDKKFPSADELMTAQELNAFKVVWDASKKLDKHPACCDTDHFKIDLMGTPRGAWNKSASRVFALFFVQKHTEYATNIPLVQQAFFSRVKTLKRLFNARFDSEETRALDRQTARRYGRKSNLFTRRVFVIKHFEPLHCHLPMMERLGCDAMSSDESDVEQDPDSYLPCVTYRIRQVPWRSDALTEFLKTLDGIYIILRREGGAGALPHLRIRGQDDDEVDHNVHAHVRIPFVNYLPRSAYKLRWLNIRAGLGFDTDVQPTNEEYSFTVDIRVFIILRSMSSYNTMRFMY